MRLPLIADDGSRGRHDTYGSALSAQPGELQRRPANKRELAAHRTDRPARTFVLPVPLSRMVAPYAAINPTAAGTAAPTSSYRLTIRSSACCVRSGDARVVGAFPDGQSALNLAAARLRHIAGTAWSTKRYLNMELLKNRQMKGAITGRRSAQNQSAKNTGHFPSSVRCARRL